MHTTPEILTKRLVQSARQQDPKRHLMEFARPSLPCLQSRPVLRYKAVCKWDLKTCGMTPANLEGAAMHRKGRQFTIKSTNETMERKREKQRTEKRVRRKRNAETVSTHGETFTCRNCNKAYHSRMGLNSHKGCCNQNSLPGQGTSFPREVEEYQQKPVTTGRLLH